MKNILVGIDFHKKTEMLVNKALELAKHFGAKIWLLHAAAPDPEFVGYEVGPQYIRNGRAQELKNENKLLLKYVNQLKEKGVDAEGLLIQGTVIDVIVDEAKKLKIDLIIFGHHEHSFLYKTFFGSMSSEIIRKSDIPVLVVPFG